ncbi:Probable aspartic protease At2g35615 [Linum perenne]
MNLSIGTPPFQLLAIADTGSDLTWVQSKPCDQCYHQKSPIFDPSNSSTLRKLPWDDPLLTSNDAVSVTTNLVNKDPSTYYYLTLEAITVGRKKLLYSKTTSSVEEGNIIIDSGTTLTFLEAEFYASLEAALVKEIKMERANDAKSVFGLCFKTGGGGGGDVKLPSMKVHFKGGAEVELKPVNTFVRAEEKLICLTMVPTKDVGIFGNLAQLNFVVGYDLGKRTVSFLPADCSKH